MIAKRIFDIVFACLGLILLSPFFLAIAIAISLETSGPVIFRQERVGQFGKTFRIHKFRTMIADAESYGPLLTSADDRRVTHVGEFLRKYKLDEFAQLIDVVKGNMSLVGPRPEVPKYVACYPEPARSVVLSLLPGMTDLASIAYKEEKDILREFPDPEVGYVQNILPDKLRYYEKYVTERSLWCDIVVIFRTLKSIVT